VTLLAEGRRLYVDVCAEVPLDTYGAGEAPDPEKVAGVDLGIIHPYVLAGPNGALVVSGRAMRAESRLHLAESKARERAVARRSPGRGQRGSRRWRKFRARTKVLEARHRRRLDQARYEAAREVVTYAKEHRIGTLVLGDPRGLLGRDSGARQNLAVRNWRVGRLISALRDRAELAGIAVVLVDERGTSSTCPRCAARVAKPKGRGFVCHHCELRAHRDVVGAANIASRSPRGGIVIDLSGLVTTHRRAGRHLPGRTRRDPRRVAMSKRGATAGPWPAVARPGDVPEGIDGESLARGATTPLARNRNPSPRAGESSRSRH
jgi:IS605 OrfB family transposase